jgi:hypothetical protein
MQKEKKKNKQCPLCGLVRRFDFVKKCVVYAGCYLQ